MSLIILSEQWSSLKFCQDYVRGHLKSCPRLPNELTNDFGRDFLRKTGWNLRTHQSLGDMVRSELLAIVGSVRLQKKDKEGTHSVAQERRARESTKIEVWLDSFEANGSGRIGFDWSLNSSIHPSCKQRVPWRKICTIPGCFVSSDSECQSRDPFRRHIYICLHKILRIVVTQKAEARK